MVTRALVRAGAASGYKRASTTLIQANKLKPFGGLGHHRPLVVIINAMCVQIPPCFRSVFLRGEDTLLKMRGGGGGGGALSHDAQGGAHPMTEKNAPAETVYTQDQRKDTRTFGSNSVMHKVSKVCILILLAEPWIVD